MTLAQWQRLFPQARVPSEQALAVLRPLVDAFHRAHVEDCEHGEISATSVQVEQNPDGTLSVRLDGSASAESADDVSGARRYQAPERWWGARQSSCTDQYALAALFVDLVTGAPPFAEILATGDFSVIRTAVSNQPPKLPADCPRRDVLLRALAKDPRLRFRSCGEFLMALALDSGTEEPEPWERVPRHHGHDETRGRRSSPRRRATHGFRNACLLALVLGAAAVWGVKSGWIDRLRQATVGRTAASGEARASVRTARADAPEPAEEARRRVRLARLEEEIRAQREVSDKALADLQTFLEKGGCGLLEVRRDALHQDLKRLQAERTTLEGEVAAAQRLEDALTRLHTRSVAYGIVSSAIPAESEVARAYAALGEAAKRLNDLNVQFTERHPEVVRQKQIVQDAGLRYFKSVEAALRHVQGDRMAKVRRFSELKSRLDVLGEESAQVERERQVARLRQDELERVRARESQRLADLRRMEMEVRFGSSAPSAATNAPASAAAAH